SHCCSTLSLHDALPISAPSAIRTLPAGLPMGCLSFVARPECPLWVESSHPLYSFGRHGIAYAAYTSDGTSRRAHHATPWRPKERSEEHTSELQSLAYLV